MGVTSGLCACCRSHWAVEGRPEGCCVFAAAATRCRGENVWMQAAAMGRQPKRQVDEMAEQLPGARSPVLDSLIQTWTSTLPDLHHCHPSRVAEAFVRDSPVSAKLARHLTMILRLPQLGHLQRTAARPCSLLPLRVWGTVVEEAPAFCGCSGLPPSSALPHAREGCAATTRDLEPASRHAHLCAGWQTRRGHGPALGCRARSTSAALCADGQPCLGSFGWPFRRARPAAAATRPPAHSGPSLHSLPQRQPPC